MTTFRSGKRSRVGAGGQRHDLPQDRPVAPNLVPPVTTSAMAAAYRDRIMAAVPKDSA
jgi:hypothetical protein